MKLIAKDKVLKMAENYCTANGTTLGRHSGVADIIYDQIENMPTIEVATVVEEESILKFYYCESEDAYYVGQRIDNFYYAKYDKNCNEFVWCMSRYLPWGEHVVDENTAWKEHTYPSEPIEIGFNEWLKGFIAKYIIANGQSVRHGTWKYKVIDGFIPDYDCVCSECGASGVPNYKHCPNCGAKMDLEKSKND